MENTEGRKRKAGTGKKAQKVFYGNAMHFLSLKVIILHCFH